MQVFCNYIQSYVWLINHLILLYFIFVDFFVYIVCIYIKTILWLKGTLKYGNVMYCYAISSVSLFTVQKIGSEVWMFNFRMIL